MEKRLIIICALFVSLSSFGQHCDTTKYASDFYLVKCYDTNELISSKYVKQAGQGEIYTTYEKGIIKLVMKYNTENILYSETEYTYGIKVKKLIYNPKTGEPLGEHYFNSAGREYKTVIYENGKRYEFNK